MACRTPRCAIARRFFILTLSIRAQARTRFWPAQQPQARSAGRPRKSRPCTTAVSPACRLQAYASSPPINSGERTRLACRFGASPKRSFECDSSTDRTQRKSSRSRDALASTRGRVRSPEFRIALFGLARCPCSRLAFAWWLPIPNELQKSPSGTLTLLDCRGREIAELASPEARTQFPVALEKMGPWLPRVTVALEDRRFYEHRGVDWRATVAACARNLRSRQIVSGASTITQQLVKLASSRDRRSWSGKLYEAIVAWKLERRWSKQRILVGILESQQLRQSATRAGGRCSRVFRETGSRSHFERSNFPGWSAASANALQSVAPSRGSKS